jgi:hypothetical protein
VTKSLDTSGSATRDGLSCKVGCTLEEMERVKYKSYGLGTGGQTGFSGSSVAAGRSLRAWR